MLAVPAAVDVPLRQDEGGVIRVGKSRVTLHSVIADFQRGASAEEIAHHYPAVSLSDVYLVIGYYLQHMEEVDRYVQLQRELAGEARRAYEAENLNDPLRTRLLALLESQRKQP